MIITTNDGASFTGEDERAIVRAMRDNCWNAPVHKGDYMAEVQQRIHEMTGEIVRTDAHGFIEDLLRLGLITVESAP